MAIEKAEIRTALMHAIHPKYDQDLISLDMVRNLIVQKKYVTFTIQVAQDQPTMKKKLVELCEDTLHKLVDSDLVLDIQTEIKHRKDPKPVMESETNAGNAEPGMDEGFNPMNMEFPDAGEYVQPSTVDPIPYEEMPPALQQLMDEHERIQGEIEKFEEALLQFKQNQWVMDNDLQETFRDFFNYLDHELLKHNRKEEKILFPSLDQKLRDNGEHSKYERYMTKEDPRTAVDIMEDEHVKFIQLSALTFNFLGLSGRLPDVTSQSMVSDLAFEQGRELVELLKLHIQQENRTLFPLACQLIDKEEFDDMNI